MCRNELTPSLLLFSPFAPYLRSNQSITRNPNRLSEGADEGGVGLLGLEAAVEEERVLTRPPGLSVRDTPSSNTNAVVEVQAGLGDGLVVGSLGASNVELGDGNLRGNGSEGLEGAGGTRGRRQVRLGACDPVSWLLSWMDDRRSTYQCHRWAHQRRSTP